MADKRIQVVIEGVDKISGVLDKVLKRLDALEKHLVKTEKTSSKFFERIRNFSRQTFGSLLSIGFFAQQMGVKFQKALGSIVQSFLEFGGPAADRVNEGLTELQVQFAVLKTEIGAALAPLLERLIQILLSVVAWFRGLSPVTKKWVGILLVLGTIVLTIVGFLGFLILAITGLLSPIGLVVVGIAGLIAIFALALTKGNTLKDGLISAFDKIVPGLGDAFGKILDIIKGGLESAWNFIKHWGGMVFNIVRDILGVVIGIFSLGLSVLTGDWKGAWSALVNIVKHTWNLIIDAVQFGINGVISGIKFLLDALSKIPIIGGLFGKLGNVIHDIDLSKLKATFEKPTPATPAPETSKSVNINEINVNVSTPSVNNSLDMGSLAELIGKMITDDVNTKVSL